MYNYKRTNNTMETITTIITNMSDEDFDKLNNLDMEILGSWKNERKNLTAKAQRICKKYGITYGDFVDWTTTN